MPKYVLGIESSCDETSAAVVRLDDGPLALLSDVTARQEEVHERWGGVVPELASRRHLESLLPVVKTALDNAGLTYQQISAIAVTNRPGLIGSLMIGVNGARTLAYGLGIPLIPINHLEAHLAAVLLDGAKIEFPCAGLIISGGHTSLYEIQEGWQGFKPLGHTRDDAAGEAFDKGARLLGLPYPGGPQVSILAEQGNPKAVDFPRALLSRDEKDFSFSGLKTSLSYHLRDNPEANKADVCASYQEAIVDALVTKTVQAMKRGGYRHLVVAGGVAANSRLRTKLRAALPPFIGLHIPRPALCTDNGAMIAALGSVRFAQGNFVAGDALYDVEVSPSTEAKRARGKQRA
ncbi:MAG: tRNA (adenosine(37)-N6)-threonylcarbamoyltransferase complex transferase subunit TsaD [Proteobacteria bacterium]|nr:MAG: tRNA (adenosine(37)-N6)-threonylcarbamoyltransferase complex transferase subunit TsaD [Pseudomonadota bacterium]